MSPIYNLRVNLNADDASDNNIQHLNMNIQHTTLKHEYSTQAFLVHHHVGLQIRYFHLHRRVLLILEIDILLISLTFCLATLLILISIVIFKARNVAFRQTSIIKLAIIGLSSAGKFLRW